MVDHVVIKSREKRSRNIAHLSPLNIQNSDEPVEANVSAKPDCLSKISSVLRRRYFKLIWDEMTEKLRENGVEKRKIIKTMRVSNTTSTNKKVRKRKKLFKLKCNRVIYKGRNHSCKNAILNLPGAVRVVKTKKKRIRRRKKSSCRKTKISSSNS